MLWHMGLYAQRDKYHRYEGNSRRSAVDNGKLLIESVNGKQQSVNRATKSVLTHSLAYPGKILYWQKTPTASVMMVAIATSNEMGTY